MKYIKQILKKCNYRLHRYKKIGKTYIIDTDNGSIVIKKSTEDDHIDKYLENRNFDYKPKVIGNIDGYKITEYIEDVNIPREQKILDLVDLVSLLHNKTTHYKEITEDYYKELYEDLSNNIYYLNSYYNDLITIIESKIYMDPSEYLLARNISIIFSSLKFCEIELEKWYEKVKEKKQSRVVVLHNNLSLDHFIVNKLSYLISWDKTKIGIPIFDIFKLYKKHGEEFDFTSILKRYESNYPLQKEEKQLLYILLAMPSKLELSNNIFNNCVLIGREIDLLYKTELLLSPYYSKETIQ